jgi:hypothetical protein
MTCLLLDLTDEHLLQRLLALMLRLLLHVHNLVASSAGHVLEVPSHYVVVLCDEGNFVTKPDGQASGPVVLVSDVSAVTEGSVSPLVNDEE